MKKLALTVCMMAIAMYASAQLNADMKNSQSVETKTLEDGSKETIEHFIEYYKPDINKKWQINAEVGAHRALTTTSKDKSNDDVYDEFSAIDINVNYKMSKHWWFGVGTGLWNKMGGNWNKKTGEKNYGSVMPFLGEFTVKANDNRTWKPWATVKAGPAFHMRQGGVNYAIVGAQTGLNYKLSERVDLRASVDLMYADIRSGERKFFHDQLDLGLKIGFSFYMWRKKDLPLRVERHTITREVPREIVREVEKVTEVTTMKFVPTPVFFKLDRVNIEDREMVNLQLLADMMKRHPETKFNIHGYADKATGTPERNIWLAEHRAENVYKALVNLGVDKYQIETSVGHGGVGIMFMDNNALSRCVLIQAVE